MWIARVLCRRKRDDKVPWKGKGTMLKAYTTVSPLSVSWATQSTSSILRVTSGIASTTHYVGSVYGVINQTMLKNDDDEGGEDYTPYGDRPETYIVPIVFLLILLIGLTGNGVLALTILRHSNMRNVPNIYVFSLALGDLLARIQCYSTFGCFTIRQWIVPFSLLRLVFFARSYCLKESKATVEAVASWILWVVIPLRGSVSKRVMKRRVCSKCLLL